ncbi:hypothetical protein SERLADRAFT_470485 [Serpula lacrymans var. lacrymans S7.9]|nr:uncharacterized protein SERLADRAFT_470485 [Serpula lacrymans var. lacrymans S7.9]EGO23953.1 hypothetical protein SERLADRAFT_470485 [Serpula lacrymans var. lacrymans S7.9]
MDVDAEPAPEDVAMNGISHPPPPDPIIKTDKSSISIQNSVSHDPESCNTIQESHNHDPTSFDQNSTWPGQYTGPASGFLQENPKIVSYAQDTPRIASLPMNPGRTIYSQQLPNRSENGLNR